MNSKHTRFQKDVLVVAVLLLVHTGFSYASSVRVFGTVIDEGGAGIPQARIDIISQDREDTTSTQTDSGGAYSVQLTLTEIGVKDEQAQIPKGFQLYQNYPNPFNSNTTISFDIPEPAKVSFVIYDILGRKVWSGGGIEYVAGRHSIIWSGTNNYGSPVATGVYILHMITPKYTGMKKILLIQ